VMAALRISWLRRTIEATLVHTRGRLSETPKEVAECVVGWRGSANRC
jgi:hypothetical protein